jgi:large subunit ribosomal protein L13
MATKIDRKTHEIDAADKILGRLATEIAIILRGKHKPTFSYNQDNGDFVVVKNAGKIKLSGTKAADKMYRHHSGYLGGLKEILYKDLVAKKPGEAIRMAVLRMLPKNKLQMTIIKRLKVTK